MGHDHAHAPHTHARGGNRRLLGWALALNTSFVAIEVVGGVLTGSLALLADAGHMVSDSASLALALLASRLADRPATAGRTFGLQRVEILAALFNALTLVAISVWIFYEAYRRLFDPPEILGGPVLAVATVGLLVNAAAAGVLMRSEGEDLNVSAAFRHLIADVLGSVGVIVAALLIIFTGWRYADPLVSALIAALILGSAWPVLRDSVRVLLEAAPRGIDPAEVGGRMAEVAGVVNVHDLHVWTITSGFPALSAHVVVRREKDCHAVRRELDELLERDFSIEHTTLQVDHSPDNDLLAIAVPEARGRGYVES
ncbi:MAG: cation diffusion facilitator family transporter [Thermoleophilaceae bacterium]